MNETQYNMQEESNALRVIGQALETLRINNFALEKKGDKYIVTGWEAGFLKSIANEIWNQGNSGPKHFTNKPRSDLLVYDRFDTKRLETTGRTKRGSKMAQSASEVSSGLRVVGDYLDKKCALAFNVWWSPESVRVSYETAAGGPKETTFTVQNLHDHGVSMYIRRSSR